MHIYAFELGHQPHISTAEIKAVFSAESTSYDTISQTKKHLILSLSQPTDVNNLMSRLGGTIKIMEQVNEDNLVTYLDTIFPEGKITFSLSGPNAKQTALRAKKELKAMKRSVRYVEAKNTATILHNNLVEKQSDITIIDKGIFVTHAIQPMNDFATRDFGRPGRDDKSGMLPPKLARMLINISQAKKEHTLLDPYCGSGTILMEALLMDFTKVIGTDISPKAIEDTNKNLQWLKEKQLIKKPLNELTKVYQLDIRHLTKKLGAESVDHIVFEPYMGKPLSGKEIKKQLQEQTRELKRLYINAFRECYKTLSSGGNVTGIIPAFKYEDQWITVNCLEEIEKIGFTPTPLSDETPYLRYHRPNQHIARDIYQFQKN